MSPNVYAGIGRVAPNDLARFETDLNRLAGLDGVVFLDPVDGVHPMHLAHRVCSVHPGLPLVLPLVTRDRNRTALLAEARAIEAFGALGVLAVTGHLDPSSPVRPVYEVDVLQLLHLLRAEGARVESWVAGRLDSPAARARVASLTGAGAVRCLVPWQGAAPDASGISVVHRVEEDRWRVGDLPSSGDRVLVMEPGAGADLVAVAGRVE